MMKTVFTVLFIAAALLSFRQLNSNAAIYPDEETDSLKNYSTRYDTVAFQNSLTTEIISYDPLMVRLEWMPGPDTSPIFNFYQVKRNGITFATTSATELIDNFPFTNDIYCYQVCPVFDTGNSLSLCTYESCVEFTEPDISLNQSLVTADIFPEQQKRVRSLVVRNDGGDGSMLSFEVDVDTSAGFIKGITPNEGLLPDWGGRYLDIICNATGYASGTYTQDFQILSNDPDEPSLTVTCQMNVVEPGFISGNVKDFITTDPLPYVSVSAGSFTTETDSAGNYILDVLPGTYDVAFHRIGFKRDTIHDQNILTSDTSNIDILLHDKHYPALFTTATLSEDESECLVKMGPPGGPYLSAFDDGTAEDLLASDSITYTYAVKFSIDSLSSITGANIFVGEGLFPPGGRFLSSFIMTYIFDDDGPGGTPGSILDSTLNDISHYDWNPSYSFSIRPGEGEYYLGIKPLGNWPDIAPIGIDENGPHAGVSYRRTPDGNWEEVTNGNLMIRPIIDGTINYPYPLEAVIGRHSNFDPFDPTDHGNMTVLDTFPGTNYEYVDTAFHSLEQGYYEYSHAYIYPDGQESDRAYSNITGRLMRYDFTINISCSDGGSPEGAIVKLQPECNTFGAAYYELTPANGVMVITDVWCGEYVLNIFKNGYYPYMESELYLCDTTEIDVVMQEGLWPASNLWVDPLTSVATWEAPHTGHLLEEDFEDGIFPPHGWISESEGAGWFRTEDGSSANWSIPAGDGFYACTNDDAAGSTNDACCDYLITPALDLRLYRDYILIFDSYFDALNECSAYVEVSTDGSNWDLLETLTDTTAWQQKLVDLSDWSGHNAIDEDFWIGFHFDDNGRHSSGWAIDNVKVLSASMRGTDEVLAYQVDLDGQYKGSTTDTTWTYQDLVYGQTYTAAVTAQFANGNAEELTATFVSEYLAPPDSLQAEANPDAIELTWVSPDTTPPDHLLGYHIYRNAWGEDDDPLVFIDDTYALQYNDSAAAMGNHQYVITAVYDLEIYGYPGEQAESMIEGPVDVDMQTMLPFTQSWSSGMLGDWTSNSGNWFINNSSGNPPPAVEFNAGKRMMNYEDSLMSPVIYASQYDGSLVYLVFDLKLEDISANGTEKFAVRLYVGDSVFDIWQTRNYGNLNWLNYDLDITEHALGKDFRIGFVAMGEDAGNISNWGIDNIIVDLICPAPFDFNVDFTGNDKEAIITWMSPDTLGPDTTWLHYDDGMNFSGVGMNEPGEFDAAIRFIPSQLDLYMGSYLKEIRFFPLVEECNYSIRVWKGENAANLVFEQPVTDPEIGEWNTVELDLPVLIEENQELWFGYRANGLTGYPAGVDAGPAIAGYGDMIYQEDAGWVSMYMDHGMDFNWNIQGFVSSVIDGKERQMIAGKTETSTINNRISNFSGYNIYYKQNNDDPVKLNNELLTGTSFIHEFDNYGDYNCYFVEAVYEHCISSLTDEECLPYIPGYGEYDGAEENIVKIFPNPASDHLNISSSVEMKQVSIYNYTGRKMLAENAVGSKEFVLETGLLEEGLYIIRIETSAGIATRKVTIIR